MTSDEITASPAASVAGPYSPVVRCPAQQDLIFVSGQLPVGEGGGLEPGGVGEQVAAAVRNALAVASSAGAGAEDVVKVTVYTTDISDMEALNRAYVEALGGARPARTTVEVSRLPKGALVEVDLIATVPARP